MSEIIRTERGWAGHFIDSASCNYRRNTLLEYEDRRIVISTIGNYRPNLEDKPQQIGHERYYETMAFYARKSGPYWESDVRNMIEISSAQGIYANNARELPIDVDLQADAMHEAVVEEMIARIVL